MFQIKYLILFVLFPLINSSLKHEYYVSVTTVEYAEDEKSLQIISQIFIDDFENALRQRYDDKIVLASDNEYGVNDYMERYLKSRLKVWINNTEVNFNYLGKEYKDDIVYCYLELTNITNLKSIKMQNNILHEVFEGQQNIARFKIFDRNKSFLLVRDNAECMLNFD